MSTARERREALEIGVSRLLGGALPESAPELEEAFDWARVRGGEYLFRAGEQGDALYIVDRGRLCVLDEDGRIVCELSEGEIVGELALLSDMPRSASVLALRDTDLVRMHREGFHRLMSTRPQAVGPILGMLAQRLRDTISPRRGRGRRVGVVAVVPATGWDGLHPFIGGLARELRRYGTVSIDSPIPEDDVDPGRYLDEDSRPFDYVLHLTDGPAALGTRPAVRDADMTLVLVDPARPADPGLLAAISAMAGERRRFQRLEVVLVHPASTAQPGGALRWREAGHADGHHHVRTGSVGDAARLARHLAGRSIRLVLSGGGARGFAHYGVLRALEELDIPIDRIGGTSMGALISAQVAIGGTSVADLVERTRTLFDKVGVAREYTLPVVGLVPGRKALRAFRTVFGAPDIRDLWIDFFCVACDLTNARPVVYRHGPLWDRVRASLSIPGIWVPVFEDGRVLVDGGVVNNLPIDVMGELDGGPILASNASPDRDLSIGPEIRECPSPLALVWRRFLSRAGGWLPLVTDVLMRSLHCGSLRHSQRVRGEASLCIDLPVAPFGMLDFRKLDAIAEAGYRHALPILSAWKESPEGRAALGSEAAPGGSSRIDVTN